MPTEPVLPALTSRRRVLGAGIWVGASSWVNRLMLVGVLAVLAERLTPRQFGMLSVAGLCRNVVSILATYGLADALVYQQARIRDAARTAFLIMTMLGLLLGGAVALAAPSVASFFHIPEAGSFIRGYAVVVAIGAMSPIPLAMLTRDLAFKRRFLPEAAGGVLGGLVTIGMALGGAGIWSVLVGDIVREFVVVVLAIAVLPQRFGFGWERDVAAGLWAYGKYSLASELFEFGLQNVDYALIGRLLGPVALGYYTLAFRVAILPFLLVTSVLAGVSFPLYARLLRDLGRVREVFQSVLELGLDLVFLLGGGLVVLAPGVQVLGGQWAPAVATTRVLGLYVCLRSVAHFITPLLAGTGHPRADARLRSVWFAILATLIVVFASTGIAAVGVVQAVVAGMLAAAYLRTARRLVGVDVGAVLRAVSRRAAAAGLAGAAVLGLRASGGAWVADTTWTTLILCGSVFTLTYLAVLVGLAGGPRRVRRFLSTAYAGRSNQREPAVGPLVGSEDPVAPGDLLQSEEQTGGGGHGSQRHPHPPVA